MKEIASFVVNLLEGLRKPLRWIAVLLSILLLVVALALFEQLTGHFFFTRLERKVHLIRELQTISGDGLEPASDLYYMYQSALADLRSYEVGTSTLWLLPPLNLGDPVTWGKAVSGASLWLLFLLVGLRLETTRTERISTRAGVAIVILIIAALCAWIATLIPTIVNPWLNYIGVPVLQFVLLFIVARRMRAHSK
jgi:hypothetical protein